MTGWLGLWPSLVEDVTGCGWLAGWAFSPANFNWLWVWKFFFQPGWSGWSLSGPLGITWIYKTFFWWNRKKCQCLSKNTCSPKMAVFQPNLEWVVLNFQGMFLLVHQTDLDSKDGFLLWCFWFRNYKDQPSTYFIQVRIYTTWSYSGIYWWIAMKLSGYFLNSPPR